MCSSDNCHYPVEHNAGKAAQDNTCNTLKYPGKPQADVLQLLAAKAPQHCSLHYGPCFKNSAGLQVFILPCCCWPLTLEMCGGGKRGRRGC